MQLVRPSPPPLAGVPAAPLSSATGTSLTVPGSTATPVAHTPSLSTSAVSSLSLPVADACATTRLSSGVGALTSNGSSAATDPAQPSLLLAEPGQSMLVPADAGYSNTRDVADEVERSSHNAQCAATDVRFVPVREGTYAVSSDLVSDFKRHRPPINVRVPVDCSPPATTRGGRVSKKPRRK
jgi:hypothetical protein